MKSNISFVSFLRFPSFQGTNVSIKTAVTGLGADKMETAIIITILKKSMTLMNPLISPLKTSMTMMNPPISPLKMSMIWSRRRTTTLDLPQVTLFSRTTVESDYAYLV